jgi:hypothetical protein
MKLHRKKRLAVSKKVLDETAPHKAPGSFKKALDETAPQKARGRFFTKIV